MSTSLISIDGATHEGGGQILRSALALAVVTGKPFRITAIRANRPKPGLMRQHLAAVEAVAAVCGARVDGAVPGASELTFHPGKPRGGEYRAVVGTAGSTVLVAQAMLPALLAADEPAEVVIEGGTHNPHAPPYEFFAETFLPALRAMGAEVEATLEEYGFYPAGGGRIRLRVQPWRVRKPFVAAPCAAGPVSLTAYALVANLSVRIAERELYALRAAVPALAEVDCAVHTVSSVGPGNLLGMRFTRAGATTVLSQPGERELSSERVAKAVAAQALRLADSPATVGEHLADQLLVPMAMAGGGMYTTAGITPHFEANAAVVSKFFLGLAIDHAREARLNHPVSIRSAPGLRAVSVPRG